MSLDADQDHALAPERHVVWFRGGERPVGGGGNTVFVRPVDEAAPVPSASADPQ